ncbi:MAG: hypothetical protein AAF085_16105, partial [Planctomycetota bacterium]
VGGVVAGAGATTAWFGQDVIKRLQPSEMAGYLKANFDYLNFSFGEDKLLEFAEEYREHYEEISRESWHVFRGGDVQEHQDTMDALAMRFLMSTDFFLNGADESRPINYVMFYHPYRSPCWNPLASSGSSA